MSLHSTVSKLRKTYEGKVANKLCLMVNGTLGEERKAEKPLSRLHGVVSSLVLEQGKGWLPDSVCREVI